MKLIADNVFSVPIPGTCCECILDLNTLLANIVTGAALCESFRLGYLRCANNWDGVHDRWRPGCGRSAP